MVSGSRLTRILGWLGLASSSWFRRVEPKATAKRPGPPRRPIAVKVVQWVMTMALTNPWYGYKRIAVMCRRADQPVTNRQTYVVMKDHGLLQKKKPREAELYQAARLWELLPQGPNDLWQMDVTHVHIPGHGWWYVITVIDYYSRYLLAARLTSSYSAAEATVALGEAREAAERIHGKLSKEPFLLTDNGPSFIARKFQAFVKDQFSHVRIQYRTPTQLGLLERFHKTLKEEEVYWRLYNGPAHARECISEFGVRYNTKRPHWALIPARGGDPLTPEDVYVRGPRPQFRAGRDGRRRQKPIWIV